MEALQEAGGRVPHVSSSLAVLIHFWFSPFPFYRGSLDVGAIWEVLDVFMAIGIIACGGVHLQAQARPAIRRLIAGAGVRLRRLLRGGGARHPLLLELV